MNEDELEPYQEHFRADAQVRQLAAAVLSLAITDLIGGEPAYQSVTNKEKEAVRRSAEEWFSDNENTALFSFRNICEILDLHQDWIRNKINNKKCRAVRRSKRRA